MKQLKIHLTTGDVLSYWLNDEDKAPPITSDAVIRFNALELEGTYDETDDGAIFNETGRKAVSVQIVSQFVLFTELRT
jgi:hypothetical protein